MRASIWIRKPGRKKTDLGSNIVIDTGPDFRAQALKFKIPRIDAVLYTHSHADHVGGIDDLRGFNFAQNSTIPVFASPHTAKEIRTRFGYIFSGATSVGGGLPRLDLQTFDPMCDRFDAGGLTWTPLPLHHGPFETICFRLANFAYLVDFNSVPEVTLERLRGVDTLLLDCVRIQPHSTHLHLEGALELARKIGAKRTFLTHLGHEFEHRHWSKKLPRDVKLAYDGLKLKIEERSS
jgi:phosphoribosyl 1,2-cyclic phosphate phosphodiesterase